MAHILDEILFSHMNTNGHVLYMGETLIKIETKNYNLKKINFINRLKYAEKKFVFVLEYKEYKKILIPMKFSKLYQD